jgi:hypothetical protein
MHCLFVPALIEDATYLQSALLLRAADPCRHARACPGHPRLTAGSQAKRGWDKAPAMTKNAWSLGLRQSRLMLQHFRSIYAAEIGSFSGPTFTSAPIRHSIQGLVG